MIMLVLASQVLLGCAPQPESMFEQKAEEEAANEIGAHSTIQNYELSKPSTSSAANALDKTGHKQALPINISKQQTIARQPNCNAQQTSCQYLEINTLAFTPPQPWLANIMWQTVARTLSPDTPFISQQQVARDSVSALLKQIEFRSEGVSSQPKYQRIDTDLILNQGLSADSVAASNGSNMDSHMNNEVMTGYLLVESTQQRSEDHQQGHRDYVMLDMQKKLQLTVEDVLLADADTQKLLSTFNTIKKQWLAEQGVEQQYLEEWPLPLSEQWYIDQQGLHLVYQSGELLNTQLQPVDFVVPFTQLQGIVKPSYMVRLSTSMTSS
ncbi:hypothetical protein [uncultured Psychrobacter sp.]|jgi:hypothetical protein|uniref:hypothetical protein n=1 Tax=uncultured Psychrobacter sp. TaxID=259303 RepID=UPI00261B34C9|nr:hypothetical protein [uncultured Psychrobacter sp.]